MKNLSELSNNLSESNLKKAKARIKQLRKQGKKDVDIIRTIHGEFKGMDSFELLGLMEALHGIPLTEDLVPYEGEKLLSEQCSGEQVIFIPSPRGKSYYIEGFLTYDNLSLSEDKEIGIVKELKCELCGSDEHVTEDCTNIEEVVKNNPKIVAHMCNEIRKEMDNGLNNRDILDLMIEMNKKKEEKIDKTFEFKGDIYNIEEQTKVIKDIITTEDTTEEVYGECKGKLFEIKNAEFETDCLYVNVTSFKPA